MKKLFCFFTLFCFLSVAIFAQKERQKAESNALDCVAYLIKLEDNSSYFKQLKQLSISYWNSNRRVEALKTVELLDEDSVDDKVELYLIFAEDALKKNEEKESSRLLLLALKYVDKNEFKIGFSNLDKLAYNLALIGNEAAANKLIDSIDEKFFKAEFLVTIANAFQKKGQSDKALKLLPTALKFAEESASEKQTYSAIASIARKYLDLGESDLAVNLFERVEADANADTTIFDVIFQSYLELNLFDKAENLIKNHENFNDAQTALKNAELSYQQGNKEKTIKYLQTAAVFADKSFDKETKLYPYDFAENVTILFLKIDEDILALDFAKKIKQTVPQQFSLFKIADYYYQKQLINSAEAVLNIAFEKVKDADKSQFDFDHIAISVDGNRIIKEWFLHTIADDFILLNKPDAALKVINSIEIPYYRAGSLAINSLKQKDKISKSTLLQNLGTAKLLIENDKESLNSENKIKYWLTIANGYYEIGEIDKSLETFAFILNKINAENDLNEGDKINLLITVGDWLVKSKNESNPKIRESLVKIIQKWKEDLE